MKKISIRASRLPKLQRTLETWEETEKNNEAFKKKQAIERKIKIEKIRLKCFIMYNVNV
jgi:hypothetical protein